MKDESERSDSSFILHPSSFRDAFRSGMDAVERPLAMAIARAVMLLVFMGGKPCQNLKIRPAAR
jgi:hypothetical protein